MAELKTPRRSKRKKEFLNFMETLFPEGNIPSEKEIFEKVKQGDNSVGTYFINKMYTDGVPVDNFLLQDPETSTLATQLKKTFQDVGIKEDAPNLTSLTDRLSKITKKGITLDSPYDDLIKAKPFGEKTIIAYQSMYDKTKRSITKLPRPPAQRGTRKLVEGAIPPGVLKTILTSIKTIPIKEDGGLLRDAVITALIGYRGADVSGIQTTLEEAMAEFPVRPYYDIETGTLQAPNIQIGGGKKKKGPEKQLGPFLKSVLDRRFKFAVEGELFPGIGTDEIGEALNQYVYPNLPDSVRAKLKKDPTGFTDIRRIFASAVANDLGKPDIASALIGHKGKGFDADTVMGIFYTDVVDKEGFKNRKDALLEFEKLLAKSLKVKSAQDLAFALGSPFESNKDFIYPVEDFDGKTTGATQEVQLSDEELEAKRNKNLAQDKADRAALNLKTIEDTVKTQQLTAQAAKGADEFVANQIKLEITEKAQRDKLKDENLKKNKDAKLAEGKKNLQSLFDESPDADTTQKVEVSTDNVDPQTGKRFTPAKVAALTAAGIFFVSSAGGSELIQDIATETAVEGTAGTFMKAFPRVAATTLGKAGPAALTAGVLPTSDLNLDEVQQFAREDVEQKFFTDPSMTARPIYRDDPRLPEQKDIRGQRFLKSALPRSELFKQNVRTKGEVRKQRKEKLKVEQDESNKLAGLLSQGQRDVTPGFVTPPNRSDLKKLTERQLKFNNFLGR